MARFFTLTRGESYSLSPSGDWEWDPTYHLWAGPFGLHVLGLAPWTWRVGFCRDWRKDYA